ncbi:MAG: hypothetical protein R3B72_30505 [Polyangiaceae bacterium]
MAEATTAPIAWPDLLASRMGRGRGFAQPQGLHQLRLRVAPGMSITLPPGLMSVVDFLAGRAHRIVSTLVARYVSPEKAIAIAHDVTRQLVTAGLAEEPLDDSRDPRVILEAHARVRVASLVRDQLGAHVEVRRVMRAEDRLATLLRLPHDACLVTLDHFVVTP